MSISKYAKELGRRGGKARAKKLSKGRKAHIAKLGAEARVESLRIAKRIIENFMYWEAVCVLAPLPKVRSVKNVNHKLPGIYV
ncbi:MAG: hypothetical protein ABII18_13710 [bacterium]|nr:hypothetical protein [bacterium]MBU1918708.1 hypothetical protein [bacterium]